MSIQDPGQRPGGWNVAGDHERRIRAMEATRVRTEATIATTVAGLGTPWDGKLGMLRVSGSPYGFMTLVYDATYGKWLSPVFQGSYLSDTFTVTTTSTSYISLPTQDRGWLGDVGAWYASGLRLQTGGTIFMFNSGSGNTTYARVAIREYDAGDTATIALWTSTSEMSVAGATGKYDGTAWADVTAGTPTKGEGHVVIEGKVSAGTGSFSAGVSRFRWVSA